MNGKLFISMTICFLATGCATHLTGTVVGPEGTPVAAMGGKVNILRLSPASASPSALVVDIDKAGRFTTTTDLEDGEYLIEPLIPDYKGGSLKLTLNESQEITLNVTPVAKPKASAIDANVNLDVGRGAGQTMLTPPNL